MAADGWAGTVRRQLGLGRLLPLGGPDDGAWITERAASGALRAAAAGVEGVRLDRLRLALADPGSAPAPTVPPPVSALPPGPVRIEAECAARALSPLPETARRLREALLGAAERGLGLDAAGADVRIVALLEGEPAPPPEGTEAGQPLETPQPEPRRERGSEEYAPVAAAVLAVPGVTRFAPMLGGLARAVRVQGVERVHVEVQLAVATSHRAVEVARAVRAAVAAAMAADTPEPVTVAVVVTAVETP